MTMETALKPPPVVAVVGPTNSGKTTLVEKLIRELCARGYRVATVKHAPQESSVDLPGSDPEAMYHSLNGTLKQLPDETLLFPGHLYSPEGQSTMGEQKATNPFLRFDSPEIIANVRRHRPGVGDDAVSILGAVRSMKDSF